MTEPWTPAALQQMFPEIQWRLPVLVQWPGRATYSCRLCIAMHGLKAESGHQWPTEAACERHIEGEHAS